MAWMYMVIAFPGLITAFLGASVLSTNITWLYPTVAAGFFLLQFLSTFGLTSETAGKDLKDNKQTRHYETSQTSGLTADDLGVSVENGDVSHYLVCSTMETEAS